MVKQREHYLYIVMQLANNWNANMADFFNIYICIYTDLSHMKSCTNTPGAIHLIRYRQTFN